MKIISLDTCTIKGCGRKVKARGLCNRHYLQQYRTDGVKGQNRTERALAFVEECVTSTTDDCLFPLFQPKSEYPSFVLNGVYYKLGWLVLEKVVGPRPAGQEMRHLCGNRRCCNPKHLAWGTHLENMDDWKKHGCAGDRTGVKNPNYRHGRNVRRG